MTDTPLMDQVLGADISSHQLHSYDPPNLVSFEQLYASGLRWYIKRVGLTWSSGLQSEDIRWKGYEDDNTKLLDLGRYHVLRVEWDVKNQVETYLGWVAGRPVRRVWVDLETQHNLTPSQAADRLEYALDLYEKGTGIVPGIYTRQTHFDVYFQTRTRWSMHPLWQARYVAFNPDTLRPLLRWNATKMMYVEMSSPWADGWYKMRGWPEHTIFQFTDRGPGKAMGVQSEQLDLNLFNGTMADLAVFAGSEPVPEPEPEPVLHPVYFKLAPGFDYLNIRGGPGVQYPIVGRIGKDDRLLMKKIHGWIEWAPGRFCAVNYDGTEWLVRADE